MPGARLVVVKECGSRAEAELAETALRSADIEAMIQADTAGGMREHLAWSGAGFKIVVREEDAPAANDFLNPPGDVELPDANSDSRPSWRRFT